MWNEDGRVCVVFNGEIYNHASCARNSTQRGHVFQLATIPTPKCWCTAMSSGARSLPSRLNGMFAFAFFDDAAAATVPGARPLRREAALLLYRPERPVRLCQRTHRAAASFGHSSASQPRRCCTSFSPMATSRRPSPIYEGMRASFRPATCLTFDIAAAACDAAPLLALPHRAGRRHGRTQRGEPGRRAAPSPGAGGGAPADQRRAARHFPERRHRFER